jgi:hypothetical protein
LPEVLYQAVRTGYSLHDTYQFNLGPCMKP